MKELLLILLKKDAISLGAVRCQPGLRVAEIDGKIWLRGIPLSDPGIKIRQLPAIETFLLDPEDRLFAPGNLTPTGKLPVTEWEALQEFCGAELPVAAMPGELKEKARVRLVPSEKIEKGAAIVTNLLNWKAYAEHAPEIRLQKIQFAVSDNDRVIITGEPLVPVPGKEYHLRDSILLPAGYDFDPPLISALLARRLNPQKDALLLFDVDGSCERIPLDAFVRGKRSAVRLTEGGKS